MNERLNKPLTLKFYLDIPPELGAGLWGYTDTIKVTFKSGYHPWGYADNNIDEFVRDFREYLAECYDTTPNNVRRVL